MKSISRFAFLSLASLAMIACGGGESKPVASSTPKTDVSSVEPEEESSSEEPKQAEYDVHTLAEIATARAQKKIRDFDWYGRYVKVKGKITQVSVYGEKNDEDKYGFGTVVHYHIQDGAYGIEVRQSFRSEANILSVGNVVEVKAMFYSSTYYLPYLSVETPLFDEGQLTCSIEVIDEAISVADTYECKNFTEASDRSGALMSFSLVAEKITEEEIGLKNIAMIAKMGEEEVYVKFDNSYLKSEYPVLEKGATYNVSGAVEASNLWKHAITGDICNFVSIDLNTVIVRYNPK